MDGHGYQIFADVMNEAGVAAFGHDHGEWTYMECAFFMHTLIQIMKSPKSVSSLSIHQRFSPQAYAEVNCPSHSLTRCLGVVFCKFGFRSSGEGLMKFLLCYLLGLFGKESACIL